MKSPGLILAVFLSLVGASEGRARADSLVPSATPPSKAQDPLVPAATSAPAKKELSPHALAVRARWLTVPGWSLGPYLDAHTQLDAGYSVGLEYLYRKPGAGFDVVLSLDYSWLNGDDGNYLGKGNDPLRETHYLHFDTLSALTFDASLIWYWTVLPWLDIRLGGGLGFGGVFGDIYQITNHSTGCQQSPGDPQKCYPVNTGPLQPGSSDTLNTLQMHACPNGNGKLDTPESPCYRRTETYPMNVRVIPMFNAVFGLRFKVHRNVQIHLETGWRVGFFLGAGPEFRF